MPRSQIYIVPAPIGDHMVDFSVASLRVIEKTTHLFIEAEDETAERFRAKKVIRPEHVVLSFDDPDACVASAAKLIEAGTDFVVLASSGIPGFVDPGWQICDHIYENDLLDKVDMHPVGMSSALDAALAMSGREVSMFHFGGHFPEHCKLDGMGWAGPQFAIVYFVRGGSINAFLDEVTTRFSPGRIVLFRDIRKRGRQVITPILAGRPRPKVSDEPDADYVVVMHQR